MRRILIAAIIISTPVWAQEQNDAQPPEVFTSPLPKVRVVRPAEPVEQVAVPVQEGAAADGTAFDTQTDAPALTVTPDGTDAVNETLTVPQVPVPATQTAETPRVVFGVARTDADADQEAADDTTDPEDKRRSRFKRPPKRKVIERLEAPAIAVPIEPANTRLLAGARLRQLDKMTGQTETFDIGVGEIRRVARLQIQLEACRAPADNDTHGTMAFLKVWDTKYEDRRTAFTGWMFAESPALSALDHPRYDLWVISCTTF